MNCLNVLAVRDHVTNLYVFYIYKYIYIFWPRDTEIFFKDERDNNRLSMF